MAEKIKKLDELMLHAGTVLDQEVSYLVDPGENFGSLLLKVDIELKNDDEKKVIHAVAKCVPKNSIIQEYFQTQDTFKNEITWYTDIVPKFMNFQKVYGMGDVLDIFPVFLGGRINLNQTSDHVDEDGVILLENLVVSGYQVIDRRIGFDYETTKAVLRSLAKFHTVFMGMKQNNSEFYNNKIKPILDSAKEDPFQDADGDLNLDFMDADGELKHLKDRVQKNLEKGEAYGLNTQSLDHPWLGVSHNDSWITNFMVNNEKQVKLLDFQYCILKSVISDLMFVLLSSVRLKTIKNHLDEFLKYYHEKFIENLKQFNLDTSPYSYEEFLKECNYHAIHGEFGHAMYHTIYILAEKDQNQKHVAEEEGFDIIDIFKNITNNLTQKHLEKYKWLILEAEKRNWI